MLKIAQRIAADIGATPAQVNAAVTLLDGGATVPFIARYRKEVTGGLDDTQLRTLEERLSYLRELEDRRAAILASIEEQGKLSDALRGDLLAADSKARLEDLYLPYKPKRRTKAQIAREAGLEPLADALTQDPNRDPQAEAVAFVDADKRRRRRQGRARRRARDPDGALERRCRCWSATCATGCGHGALIRAKVIDGKQNEGAKFRDYFDHAEPIGRFPRTACWR